MTRLETYKTMVKCFHTCPLCVLMTCSIPCPVPTTISCSSELTTKQVGSEENVDNSLLQWNTQNNKGINITKYMSINISLDHLANDPLTWSPHDADGRCLTIQPHGPLPFSQGHVPRCKLRSHEAHWGPAGCKDLARWRAGGHDAAGSSSSLLDKHGSRLRAQRETLMNIETLTWQCWLVLVIYRRYKM